MNVYFQLRMGEIFTLIRMRICSVVNKVNQMIFKSFSKSTDIICMRFHHRVISDIFPSNNCLLFFVVFEII